MAETIDLDARDFAARVIRRLRVSKPDPRSRARQPDPLWVRVKQMGSSPTLRSGSGWGPIRDKKGGDPNEWAACLRVREIPNLASA